MYKKLLGLMIILFFTFCLLAAAGQKDASDNKLIGKWVGTWSGGSSGKFEMTVSKNSDGKLAATLIATPDQGEPNTMVAKSVDQTAENLKIIFEGGAGEVDVLMEGGWDGQDLKGSYSVRNKPQGEEVESGIWSAAKKPSRE
jgi:hypothetical protein